MAGKRSSKTRGNADAGDDHRRREEARTRERFGIEHLTDDEELIDHATFAQMNDRLFAAVAEGGAEAVAEGRPGSLCGMGGAGPVAEEDELLLEEIATVLPTRSGEAVRASRPPVDAAEVAVLERTLLAAKDRDEVAELTLRIALHYCRATALFVFNRGLVAGLRGAGEGLEDRLEGIMVPADAGTLLAAPLETGRMMRGVPPPDAVVDQRLLRAMGRADAQEIAVLPVVIGQRIVNLLYVDNGPEALSDTGLGALRVLCAGVGRVYERLIFEARLAGRGAAAGR